MPGWVPGPRDRCPGEGGEWGGGVGGPVRPALGHRPAGPLVGTGRADPTMKVRGRRFRVNIMSTIASRGSLWFTVFTGKSTAKVFLAFLDRLARQTGRSSTSSPTGPPFIAARPSVPGWRRTPSGSSCT